MIIIVALFRDLLLKEIRSQRTWGCRATGGYIILSSREHSLAEIGMKEYSRAVPVVSPQYHG